MFGLAGSASAGVGSFLLTLVASLLALVEAGGNGTAPAANSNGDISALFSDLSTTDIILLALVLLVIVLILGYMFYQRSVTHTRLNQVRDMELQYAQQQIFHQSTPQPPPV